AHLVHNDVRGIRLEGLITRLRLLQGRGVPLRLILLSAVLSRYDKLRQWLGASEASVITGAWKPTARRLAFWREQGALVWYVGDDPIRRPGTTSHSSIGKFELPWPEYEFYQAQYVLDSSDNRNPSSMRMSPTLRRCYGSATGDSCCASA